MTPYDCPGDGSSRKAEAKRVDREARVDALKIHELGAIERERFIAEWRTVQSRFVDRPKAAATEADQLIAAFLSTRRSRAASCDSAARLPQARRLLSTTIPRNDRTELSHRR